MPASLLLMIVSIAIAVLPVWRSPMISSRWPRPIGIIESMAFRPVCIGSGTGWRAAAAGGLQAGLHRLGHRLTLDDAGRLELGGALLARLDVALAVERVAQRVDDPAEQ